jgi:hypothetical protein
MARFTFIMIGLKFSPKYPNRVDEDVKAVECCGHTYLHLSITKIGILDVFRCKNFTSKNITSNV